MTMKDPGPFAVNGWRKLLRPNAWSHGLLALITLCWGVSGSWEYNRQIPNGDWKHDLRADASGYYIYLPGFFHHNFHVDDLDSTILIKAGYGFTLDRAKDRIVTKYFYGTALFESPFYLMAEAVVGWGRTDGFTDVHRRAIEAGGVFYWVLGLWLLATALQHWRPAPLWVTVAGIFAVGGRWQRDH